MKYPIAIEIGSETTAFGVQVPDLPGCFSAGDSFDEAFDSAEEAILCHIEGLMIAGEPIPPPKSAETHRLNPAFAGMVWGMVPIDLSRLEDKAERVNITLPRRVLHMIDTEAKRQHTSRSGFIAEASLGYIAAQHG